MISVQEAEQIILSCKKNYGTILVPLLQASGHILAEDILADRDLPPFHRVAMDGIAIRFLDYDNGNLAFNIAGVIAAGEGSLALLPKNACFEIMTGAALPDSADTCIPYEHLQIEDGIAHIIHEKVICGQHIHIRASDKKQGTLLISSGQKLDAVEISMAASVGKAEIMVKKLPRVAIFSSGDELVDVTASPLPYQIRRSNNYAIHTALQRYGIDAAMHHLPDNLDLVKTKIQQATLDFDVLILSGGISMGKFDYIPQAMEELGVERRFHKVKQKPGKPFWFGTFGQQGVVFALPGNPVSTYLCLLRYTLPWLEASLGFQPKSPFFAVLDSDLRFEPTLQYFLLASLKQDEDATIRAMPWRNNGSGDFSSLLEADGFLELPATQTEFRAGEGFRFWAYR